MWHLYQSKPHWKALKAHLYNLSAVGQEKEGSEQLDVMSRQNQDSDEEFEDSFIPEKIEQKVKHDIYHLNADQISVAEFHASPLYNNTLYLENFLNMKHGGQNSDPKKKRPTTQTALKKLTDQFLDEPNKERCNEGLYKAMTNKFVM
jgi:hypothetical protein